MNQHEIGLGFGEHRSQPAKHISRHVGQILPRLHQVEIIIRDDLEQFENLVEHLPMLGGHAHARVDILGLGERPDDRRHLDRFRSRAKDS